jgi:hypothetical protein
MNAVSISEGTGLGSCVDLKLPQMIYWLAHNRNVTHTRCFAITYKMKYNKQAIFVIDKLPSMV